MTTCSAQVDNDERLRRGPFVNTLPFQQLQAFLAVARFRSFSGTARELGVSRSAVSQSVRQLEEDLRVVLVVRTTRSVSLTDAGRRLLEATGPAIAQVGAAFAEASAKPGEVVGRVRLTVPRSAFHFVIEPVLPKFRARHPRIEIELVFEDRRVDVVGEGFDAGIRLSEYAHCQALLNSPSTLRRLVHERVGAHVLGATVRSPSLTPARERGDHPWKRTTQGNPSESSAQVHDAC